MKILVGLGNPERHYDNTRHNVGFAVVDRLATIAGAEFRPEKKFQALIAKTTLDRKEIILVKPLTYMNLSGQAVSAIINWFKSPLTDLLVIHDDVSLPLGRIRIKRGDGAGGQHGVESIISSLGNKKDFDRIRVGVGPDPGGDRRADFVLSTVRPEDVELYCKAVEKSAEASRCWLDKGLTTSMNIFNGDVFGVPFALRQQTTDQTQT